MNSMELEDVPPHQLRGPAAENYAVHQSEIRRIHNQEMQGTLCEFVILITSILLILFFYSCSLDDQDTKLQKEQKEWTQ